MTLALVLKIVWLGIILAIPAVATCCLSRYIKKHGERLLYEWAKQNNLVVIEASYKTFFKGPFFVSHYGQPVFHVIVGDAAGNEFLAWVRCGAYAFGRWNSTVDVRWE